MNSGKNRLTLHLLTQLVDSMDQPAVVAEIGSDTLPVIMTNQAFTGLVEREPESMHGRDLLELIDFGPLRPRLGNVLEELESGKSLEFRLKDEGDGDAGRIHRIGLRALVSKSGRATHVAGLVRSQRLAMSGRGRESVPSTHSDRVTGVPDKEYFLEALADLWESARVSGQAVSILLFEIDEFELYVNTFGANAGDSALRLTARAIAGSFRRASDLSARYEGERFIAAVTDLESAQASGLAERIAGRVSSLCIHHPRSTLSRYLTVSGGVATALTSATSIADLIDRAMAALDQAAAQGRNRIVNLESTPPPEE